MLWQGTVNSNPIQSTAATNIPATNPTIPPPDTSALLALLAQAQKVAVPYVNAQMAIEWFSSLVCRTNGASMSGIDAGQLALLQQQLAGVQKPPEPSPIGEYA